MGKLLQLISEAVTIQIRDVTIENCPIGSFKTKIVGCGKTLAVKISYL